MGGEQSFTPTFPYPITREESYPRPDPFLAEVFRFALWLLRFFNIETACHVCLFLKNECGIVQVELHPYLLGSLESVR